MKRKFYRISGLIIMLTLLVMALPATPVFAASLTLDPASGPPGTTVYVSGSGFAPDFGLGLRFDGVEIGNPQTDSNGNLADSFTVPASKAAGTYSITIVSYGPVTNISGTGVLLTLSPAVTFAVTGTGTGGTTTGTATITLDPTTGFVGSDVQILGSNFGASKAFTISYDIDDIAAQAGSSTQTNSSGELKAFILIPPSTAGAHNVKVKDTGNVEGKTTFTVKPKITFTPDKGAPNTNMTVTGSGFGRSLQVRIFFNEVDIGAGPQTDTNGSFQYQFTIQQKTPGEYTIRAQDDNGNSSTPAEKFKLELPARVDATPNKGGVGTKVNVSGIGFKPNSTITIKYDDKPNTTNSDANGTFSMTLTVPDSKTGAHTINITDGTNSKDVTFTVESTPPSTPSLQSPALYSQLQEPTKFVWGKSTDESLPITYKLQVATTGDFASSSVVLEKKGLKETEYMPTKEEWTSLAPPPLSPGATQIPTKNYYWRVIATDATSVDSEIQSPSLFTVFPPAETPEPAPAPTDKEAKPATQDDGEGKGLLGSMPSWAMYVIAFLIALLFFIVGLFIGRRTAYY